MKLAGNLEGGCDSICSFCSRMKRGRIYKCARDNGYNVMALGQHLDDLAERYVTTLSYVRFFQRYITFCGAYESASWLH